MNISLTPELEQFVLDQVQSGQYKSSSEVIREALRNQLRDSVESSLDMRIARARVQAKEGKTIVADANFFRSKRERVSNVVNQSGTWAM